MTWNTREKQRSINNLSQTNLLKILVASFCKSFKRDKASIRQEYFDDTAGITGNETHSRDDTLSVVHGAAAGDEAAGAAALVRRRSDAGCTNTSTSAAAAAASTTAAAGASKKKDASDEKMKRLFFARNTTVYPSEAGAAGSAKDHGGTDMTVTRSVNQSHDGQSWNRRPNIKLVREPNSSFGICIVGGKVNLSKDSQISGIFIKNIIADSPAEGCGKLQIGDHILSVNGEDVREATQDQAIRLIKQAGCSIVLDVESVSTNDNNRSNDEPPMRNGTTENEAVAKRVNVCEPEVTITYSESRRESTQSSGTLNDSKQENNDRRMSSISAATGAGSDSSDEEDSRDMSGKVLTKGGMEIDRSSAGNVKRTKDEIAADEEKEDEFGYTTKKIKKRYGQLGMIIRQPIERDVNNNLGMALAGHKDRNKMGCFIAGVNPKGKAAGTKLKVGDEVLEVSGYVVHEKCHLNVCTQIKNIPGTILVFILLRPRDTPLAIKEVIHFPVFIDPLEHLYTSYKNVRSVTIQKLGTSLGIMIIEGKHAEVGTGIFISDIQDSSNAEKAGLTVGEMILAVNKDLLIECNYDTAAGALRQAEGMISLTVCNPNKEKGGTGGVTEVGKEAKPEEKKKEEEKKPEEKPLEPHEIHPKTNSDTTMEINCSDKPLGIMVVGGKESDVEFGAVIVQIIPGGIIDTDKRLKIFDRIVDLAGMKFDNKQYPEAIKRQVKQRYQKVRAVVHRHDPPCTVEMEIDVTRKAGKDLGLGFMDAGAAGVVVWDIVSGCTVEAEGKLRKGDVITHVNGDDVRGVGFDVASILIRAATGKIVFKVQRPKYEKKK